MSTTGVQIKCDGIGRRLREVTHAIRENHPNEADALHRLYWELITLTSSDPMPFEEECLP